MQGNRESEPSLTKLESKSPILSVIPSTITRFSKPKRHAMPPEDILAHAYAQCRSNKGAPGVDGQDFADIEAYGVERWLAELALALREETYRPEPIRRVFIPKRQTQAAGHLDRAGSGLREPRRLTSLRLPGHLKSASETVPRGAPCGSPRDRRWRAQAPARYRPLR